MSGEEPIRVACLGFVFDPVAQAVIRNAAPPGIHLSFAERPEDVSEGMLSDSDALLVVATVTEAMMRRAPRLRLIQKWGAGFDKIDVDAAARLGIAVAITAGANATTIAEHAIALMLAVLRRVADADRAMRAGRWHPGELRPHMRNLHGKTVGLIGFGNIGKGVARLLPGFNVELLYFRRSGEDAEGKRLHASYAPLPELLMRSDIVSLHCPGDAANIGMFGRQCLDVMKPGAVLINTARGNLVVEEELVAALRSGRLLGAGLDVFAMEPLPEDSPLRRLDNVVITPHVAGGTMDDIAPMAEHAFGNILRFMQGGTLSDADIIVPPPAGGRVVAADGQGGDGRP